MKKVSNGKHTMTISLGEEAAEGPAVHSSTWKQFLRYTEGTKLTGAQRARGLFGGRLQCGFSFSFFGNTKRHHHSLNRLVSVKKC